MKANTLLTQLQKVLPLAQGNKVIPITSCIKFDGDKTFTATDTLNEISVTLENSGLSTPFCVDAVKFTNILRGYVDKEVSFKITDTTLTIQSEKSKYKLPILSADDFPSIKIDFKESRVLDGKELSKAIKSTSFAVSTDDLRPDMTGLFFDNNNVVATDANKLVSYQYNHGFNFIVPSSSVRLLESNIIDTVSVQESDSYIRFVSGNVTLTSRKIEEKFPAYESVIPKDNQNKLTINTRSFEEVVKRLLLTADNNTNAVVLELGNYCKAYSSDIDYSVEGNEELSCQYDGEPLKIAFNGKFLSECLRSISDEVITVELKSFNRMALFNCIGKKVVLAPVVVNF